MTIGRTVALAVVRPCPTVFLMAKHFGGHPDVLRHLPELSTLDTTQGEISTTSKSRPSCTETYAAGGGLEDCLRWLRLLVLRCRLFPEALGEAKDLRRRDKDGL